MKLPEIRRRSSQQAAAGRVLFGGGLGESSAPATVVLQSMTNTTTADAAATLAQIRQLADAGAELVRIATPTQADTAAIAQIVAESPVPIVADVHYHFSRAMEAIAAGVVKIRLNPGNIGDANQVRAVIDAAGAAGVAIRVGVNEGSVSDRRDKVQFAKDRQRPLVDLMLEKMESYLDIFEQAGFGNLVLSAKSHDAVTTIAVNRAMAQRWDLPIHLGVTHAGTPTSGAIRSAAALGTLLAEGIGDTIRVSFTGDPVHEINAGRELLESLRLRPRRGVELISCPTCGRLQMDLTPIANEIEHAIAEIRTDKPIKLALMGCVVNGPGEADDADIAICCGKDKAILYIAGKKTDNLTHEQIVPTLMAEIQKRIEA